MRSKHTGGEEGGDKFFVTYLGWNGSNWDSCQTLCMIITMSRKDISSPSCYHWLSFPFFFLIFSLYLAQLKRVSWRNSELPITSFHPDNYHAWCNVNNHRLHSSFLYLFRPSFSVPLSLLPISVEWLSPCLLHRYHFCTVYEISAKLTEEKHWSLWYYFLPLHVILQY